MMNLMLMDAALIGGGGLTPRAEILATASAETLGYIAGVEAADGQELENGVLAAMVAFANYRIPLGGACCLMAGARTLDGALVPMVGAAPTAFNFVSGDYNRVTGLVGNGSTKYLSSGRNNNADGRDDNHNAVYATTVVSSAYCGTLAGAAAGSNTLTIGAHRSRSSSAVLATLTTPGLIGFRRSDGATYLVRHAGANSDHALPSQATQDSTFVVFRTGAAYGDHRLSMYSIGPAVDLEAMDTAITTCMNAIAAAGI